MRSVALVSAAFLAVSGVVVAPGVASAAAPVGRVVSVTADPGPFVVDAFSGQATSTITVMIDQPIYKAGACGRVEWEFTGAEAVLQRTSGGAPATVAVDLPWTSVSGTVQTYRAPWRIAATRGGTWTVVRVVWCDVTLDPVYGYRGDVVADIASVDPRVDPGVARSITVIGTHPPTAAIDRLPATVPYRDPNDLASSTSPLTRQFARVTYRTAAGAPIVGATVVVGSEYSCWGDPMPPTPGGTRWAEATLRTDARGQVTFRLVMEDPGQTCVSLLGPPAVAGDLGTRALVRQDWAYPRHYYKWVSAAPTARAVRVNRTLTVIGSVYPGRGVVRLQRLVGRTWRTIASATIRRSGRYTAYGLVTAIGRNYVRVVALNGDPTLAPTTSRVVVVIGTRR